MNWKEFFRPNTKRLVIWFVLMLILSSISFLRFLFFAEFGFAEFAAIAVILGSIFSYIITCSFSWKWYAGLAVLIFFLVIIILFL
jgi:hypothetical protein